MSPDPTPANLEWLPIAIATMQLKAANRARIELIGALMHDVLEDGHRLTLQARALVNWCNERSLAIEADQAASMQRWRAFTQRYGDAIPAEHEPVFDMLLRAMQEDPTGEAP